MTAKEKKELKTITEKLSQYPSGDTAEEVEDKKIIRQIISDFKKWILMYAN